MNRVIHIHPLTAESFAPFGDVLDTAGTPDKLINQGLCERYHDRAALDVEAGHAGISIFNAEPRTLPLKLEMMERHPIGSQAFIPMSAHGFLVVVAANDGDKPGRPLAFETTPGQAINFHKGTWHGVLTPLAAPGLFAVVDYVGEAPNLEEHWFEDGYLIER
ncbi:MAG: ureidoglycolate lyase [Paracoccaceae bacterium]